MQHARHMNAVRVIDIARIEHTFFGASHKHDTQAIVYAFENVTDDVYVWIYLSLCEV